MEERSWRFTRSIEFATTCGWRSPEVIDLAVFIEGHGDHTLTAQHGIRPELSSRTRLKVLVRLQPESSEASK